MKKKLGNIAEALLGKCIIRSKKVRKNTQRHTLKTIVINLQILKLKKQFTIMIHLMAPGYHM